MKNESQTEPEPSNNLKNKKKFIVFGPGIILAATGIGAGDLVTNSTAGANFGIVLAWTILIGVSLKVLVTEGVGRYTLATGKTILEGGRSLGKWTMYYFVVYVEEIYTEEALEEEEENMQAQDEPEFQPLKA